MNFCKEITMRNIAVVLLSLLLFQASFRNTEGTVYSVTTTADTVASDGSVSFREALMAANTNAAVQEASAGTGSTDSITFAVAPNSVFTFSSALPAISEGLEIDGTTILPQFDCNGLAVCLSITSSSSVAIKNIKLYSYASAGIKVDSNGHTISNNYLGLNGAGTASGLTLNAYGLLLNGNNNTVSSNYISGNTLDGVFIVGSNNKVTLNTIGLAVNGSAAANKGSGIRISGGGNRIGGAAEGNVISGNLDAGIQLSGSSATANLIFGNIIGMDSTGTNAIPNGNRGVAIISASSNHVGDGTSTRKNVISGNTGAGVVITSGNNNKVSGNYIGLTLAGTSASGNSDDGVKISNGQYNTIQNNYIGGNTGTGVTIKGSTALYNYVFGNFIGTNSAGTDLGNGGAGVDIQDGASSNQVGSSTFTGSGNTIKFNSIGIIIQNSTSVLNTLSSNIVSQNSATIGDIAFYDKPNHNIGTATVLSVGEGFLTYKLSNFSASTSHRVEFFASSKPSTSAPGDAEAYLGFANVVTDSSGNVGTSTFTFKKRTVEYAPYVTATVTAVGGDTGQFASKVLQQITLCQEEERVYAHYLEYRRSVVTDRTFRINRSHRLKELDDLAFDSCDDIINKIDVDDRANDTINNLHAYSSCDYADVFNVTHADYEEFGLANATGTSFVTAWAGTPTWPSILSDLRYNNIGIAAKQNGANRDICVVLTKTRDVMTEIEPGLYAELRHSQEVEPEEQQGDFVFGWGWF